MRLIRDRVQIAVATRYATHKRSSSNVLKLYPESGRALFFKEIAMEHGRFYFLVDEYFTKFNDANLMNNREMVGGIFHDRPSFYAYYDEKSKIFWLVPISSKLEKFKNLYDQKIQKYGRCDTIVFGNVLGHEKAFLIQNMSPVIPKYIKNQYVERETENPVQIDGILEKELQKKVKRVLSLLRQGKKLVFPNVLEMERILKEEMKNNI
ncbi:hypothetical protein DSECCO2_622170 [anaerobic digester metagenome]